MKQATPASRYDRIGAGYNQTRKADPHLAGRLIAHLKPESGKTYLDIGCGTGNYTCAVAAAGGEFIGVEPSKLMLDVARPKSETITWKQGVAENIPVSDASMDGAMGTLTLHHWSDLERGMQELARVLKPGSTLVFLVATPEQTAQYWLTYYFPEMIRKSVDMLPATEGTLDALRKAGMQVVETEKYFVKEDLQDLFLYAGKHRPELYFDPQVRQGISSFSHLSNQPEVEQGLAKMKVDMESGKINEVIQRYEHDLGDYLFIVARKPQP